MSLFDLLFGCSHQRCSFPITVKKIQSNQAASVTGTYIVCLDCGREFPYDWEEMKMIRSTDAATPEPIVGPGRKAA